MRKFRLLMLLASVFVLGACTTTQTVPEEPTPKPQLSEKGLQILYDKYGKENIDRIYGKNVNMVILEHEVRISNLEALMNVKDQPEE